MSFGASIQSELFLVPSVGRPVGPVWTAGIGRASPDLGAVRDSCIETGDPASVGVGEEHRPVSENYRGGRRCSKLAV
jgi:hypothetical protein